MQGDLATATTLMEHPTVDWEHRTANAQQNGAFTSYHLVGAWTATDRGLQAWVVWDRGQRDAAFRSVCATVVVTPAGNVRVTGDTALCTR